MKVTITKTSAGTLLVTRDDTGTPVTETRLYNTGANLKADANNVVHIFSKSFPEFCFGFADATNNLGATDAHSYVAAAAEDGLFAVATTATT